MTYIIGSINSLYALTYYDMPHHLPSILVQRRVICFPIQQEYHTYRSNTIANNIVKSRTAPNF